MQALLLVCAFLGSAQADSPVAKVIELLQANKVKVQADLDAEAKEMVEYAEFCDTESSEKGYAIKTAERKILDLTAVIQDGESQVLGLNDEVSTLGSEMAGKERKLLEATEQRKAKQTEFKATEKALVESVDQLSRAMVIIKREMSFLQGAKGAKVNPKQRLQAALSAIDKVLDSANFNVDTKKALKSLMQTQTVAGDNDDLKLGQPQAKVSAYESHSGGIVEQIGDMKEKAEETLSGARNAEMKEAHNFAMMEQSLTDAIKNCKDKLSGAKSSIASYTEANGKAKGELTETEKTKAADTAYLESLTAECTETHAAWGERQASAKEEMAVLDKAKAILADRVKVFVQVSGKKVAKGVDADDEDDKDTVMRKKVVSKLKDLSHEFKSYALMEMVSVASSDPFEKVRGLIEGMIEKLVNEANEEATQKAFCDEETSKSKKAQAEKSMTSDKLTSRIDKATTTKAQLEQSVKDLEAEVAALDKGNAEATSIRTEEKATNTKAAADFKEAAEAVTAAIGVLKEYYESALIQTSTSKRAPDFGGAKGDAASSIISILEMSEENFTKMYMQIETAEQTAAADYAKLMDENKVSKTSKQAEVKGSLSEIKSLDVALKNNQEDLGMTTKELDAVMAYLEKLKPQCETKVMSYAEKKARREAEIEGLKEALSILDAPALIQLRGTKRH
jgi:chromosome segregation ATPase